MSKPLVVGALAIALMSSFSLAGCSNKEEAGTLTGAVVGGVIGNTMRTNAQRCQSAAAGAPQYWDTVYDWHGVQHHMQTTAAPGTTVTVNANGEPRAQAQ